MKLIVIELIFPHPVSFSDQNVNCIALSFKEIVNDREVAKYFVFRGSNSQFRVAIYGVVLIISVGLVGFVLFIGVKDLLAGQVENEPVLGRMNIGNESLLAKGADDSLLVFDFNDEEDVFLVVDVFMEVNFVERVVPVYHFGFDYSLEFLLSRLEEFDEP